MDIGVFIPINNNGWLLSAAAPQYMPSFELNKRIVQKAEALGFDFALSMIKLHGFGGTTEFWDHGLESFTLMAGLASVTSRIRLFASVAVLTIPPAIVARMTSTIADISGGRFGVNIVSGWHKIEYSQMGLWPGDQHFGRRYDYSTEYVRVLRDLWETGHVRPEGRVLPDGRLQAQPAAAGAGAAGGRRAERPRHAVRRPALPLQLRLGRGRERAHPRRRPAGPDAGGTRAPPGATSAPTCCTWSSPTRRTRRRWPPGTATAPGRTRGRSRTCWARRPRTPAPAAGSMAAAVLRDPSPINFDMGTLVGSFARVASMLDEVAAMPGVKGIMLTFDDFLRGLELFGERVQPLMRCRQDRAVPA